MVKIKKGRCCKQNHSCFFRRYSQKKGEVTWELVRTILFVALLVTMVLIVVVLLKGRGGELLDSVSRILRFGR